MRKPLFLIIVLFVGIHSFAEKAPIRFGKPSLQDLKKNIYKIDTTASAIILCNYGTFNPDKLLFDRIIRVKILKKSGLTWGNWTFRSLARANIRGKTFNLVNGKIVSTKLSKKSILHEDISNGYYVTKVTMPDVKVGSVIDIELTYSEIPSAWYFQESIPMLYSELDMYQSSYLNFKKNYFGYIPFDVNTDGRWVTKNVPAFQSEPFSAPSKNYMAHFEFDLLSITLPGQTVQEFASSWQQIRKRLYDDAQFGDALERNPHFFKELGDSIKKKAKTDVEKVKAALAVVHRIKWNGKNRLFSSSESGLRYVFNKREGNSADINLSLINILNYSGLEAYPIITRTRDEGHLSMYSATLFNLNYVLAYVKVDTSYYVVDGTEKNLPFPYLPERCQNGEGRVLLKGKTDWVKLSNNVQSAKKVFSILTLDKNQNLTGTVSESYTGQYAYSFRKQYKDLGSHEKFINNEMQANSSLTITKDTLLNLNNVQKPLVEKSSVVYKNQLLQVDSLSYLYLVPDRMTENPFKQDKRKYPVDFVHPFVKSGVILINLPTGYKVAKLPQSVMYSMPNKSGSFLFRTGVSGSRITVIYRFSINKPLFIQNEYKTLKGLYLRIIKKESQPVVLKKM